MKFEDFVKLNYVKLFDLWKVWVPLKKNINKKNINKKVYYVDDEEYNFHQLIDYGDHVLSFDDFVCCAYENSIK